MYLYIWVIEEETDDKTIGNGFRQHIAEFR